MANDLGWTLWNQDCRKMGFSCSLGRDEKPGFQEQGSFVLYEKREMKNGINGRKLEANFRILFGLIDWPAWMIHAILLMEEVEKIVL